METFKKTILITGASGSIGSELAKVYANAETILILHGRKAERLQIVAEKCRQKGAIVITKSFDLTNTELLLAFLDEINSKYTIDLVIINAGLNTNIGPECKGEDLEEALNVIDVNFRCAVIIVNSVLSSMRRRKKGQIALMSSLTAYFGLPFTPTYSATKSAIKTLGESLRGWLEPEGIKINVVMPGYVESEMCKKMPGPKPFLLKPEKAALIIKQGLEHNKFRISFPFPLNFGVWWLSVLPPYVSSKILGILGYRCR